MGVYNQYHPTVLGMEFAPVVRSPILLDTATSIGYRFTPVNLDDLQLVRVLTTDPLPGQALRKCLAADVYPHGNAPSTGVVRTMLIPCNSGTLGSGAANSGGATVADCVRNPSDVAYTSLTGANSSVRLWFDVLASRVSRALTNARILDVTVRYAATGPFDTLPDGLVLALERPSASVVFDMDNALTGPTNQYDNVVPHRSRLGDLNPFWATSSTPNTNYRRAPWHYAAGVNNHTGLTMLAASGGTNVNVRFATSAAAAGLEWRIQYCALEITYCVESRAAAGGQEITEGATITNDLFTYDIPMGSMLTAWGGEADLPLGFYFDVVVGQGYCGALSVAHPVPFSLPRVSTGAVYGPHEGIIIRKSLREGETWTAESTDAIPALALYSEFGSPDAASIMVGSQVYIDQIVATVDEGTATTELQARLVDDVAADYPSVRFYARVQPDTAAELTVMQVTSLGAAVGPTATITADQLVAMPEINDGWRRVTLTWSAPVTTTGAGLIYISFSTQAEMGAPWEILGADANPAAVANQDIAVPTYGDTTARLLIDSTEDYTADLTVMLVQDMPTPADLDADTAVQPLEVVDEYCGRPVAAIPTGITYVTLTWTPVNTEAVAGFAWYEVQRRDTTMATDVWETVATVTDVSQGAANDYEARIGVTSSYRIRFVHVDGYTSDWSATATATIAAPGVTGTSVAVSVLVMTTNHDPAANIAYVMAWEGSGVPAQDFTFLEGSQTVLQPMYQRDYQVAFRPLERAGVEFTRALLVNALGVPPQTLSDGFTGLRDLAWDTVPYVCVRDEQSNRWLTSVSVPSGSVRDLPRAGHLMLAQAIFTEVTATPAPIDYTADCQGLMLTGRDNFTFWRTPLGANIQQGTVVVTDTFTRTVAAGSWGTADTGQTYALSSAANSSVNGTHGVLVNTAAAAHLSATLSGGDRDFYSATVDVTLPAVATGNVYKAQMMFHVVDQIAFTDDFNRTTSPGWGTATTGQVWQHSDASLFSTTGTRGRVTLSSIGRKIAFLDYGLAQMEVVVGRVGLNAAVTGVGGIVTTYLEQARSSDGSNRVAVKMSFNTSGNTTYVVSLIRGDIEFDVTAPVDTGLASSVALACRFRVNGFRVQAKVWQSGTAEPGSFNINEDLSFQPGTGTWFALAAEKNAAVTNATMLVEWDDLAVTNTDGYNAYRLDLTCNTDGTMSCEIVSRVSNLEQVLDTTPVSGTYTVGTVVRMSGIYQGYTLDGRVWRVVDAEPAHYGVGNGSVSTDQLQSQAVSGGEAFALRNRRDSGNTNVNLTLLFDNLSLVDLPVLFDVRFLFRTIADDWSFAWNAQSNDATVYMGEWRAELSNSFATFYILAASEVTMTVPIGDLDLAKNQLIWVRFSYDADDAQALGALRMYTSTDGVGWTLKATEFALSPAGIPPLPADAQMEVEAIRPADSVWIHKVEVRVDGTLLYDPDFAAQPPGTISFEDGEGNDWTGEVALCAD